MMNKYFTLCLICITVINNCYLGHTITPNLQWVSKGQSVTLKCTIAKLTSSRTQKMWLDFRSDPKGTIIANNSIISDSYTGGFLIKDTNDLYIDKSWSTMSLAGQYGCRHVQANGTQSTGYVKLGVLEGPKIVRTQPSESRVLLANEVVKLTCEAHYQGELSPLLRWRDNNKHIVSDLRRTIPKNKTTLHRKLLELSVMLNATAESNGQIYLCELYLPHSGALNHKDQSNTDRIIETAKEKLNIHFAPKNLCITDANNQPIKNNTEVSAGNKLKCNARSNPEPSDYRWLNASDNSLLTNHNYIVLQPSWIGSEITLLCIVANNMSEVENSMEQEGIGMANITIKILIKASRGQTQTPHVDIMNTVLSNRQPFTTNSTLLRLRRQAQNTSTDSQDSEDLTSQINPGVDNYQLSIYLFFGLIIIGVLIAFLTYMVLKWRSKREERIDDDTDEEEKPPVRKHCQNCGEIIQQSGNDARRSGVEVTDARRQSGVEVTGVRKQSGVEATDARKQSGVEVTGVRRQSGVEVTGVRRQSGVEVTDARRQSGVEFTQQSNVEVTRQNLGNDVRRKSRRERSKKRSDEVIKKQSRRESKHSREKRVSWQAETMPPIETADGERPRDKALRKHRRNSMSSSNDSPDLMTEFLAQAKKEPTPYSIISYDDGGMPSGSSQIPTSEAQQFVENSDGLKTSSKDSYSDFVDFKSTDAEECMDYMKGTSEAALDDDMESPADFVDAIPGRFTTGSPTKDYKDPDESRFASFFRLKEGESSATVRTPDMINDSDVNSDVVIGEENLSGSYEQFIQFLQNKDEDVLKV